MSFIASWVLVLTISLTYDQFQCILCVHIFYLRCQAGNKTPPKRKMAASSCCLEEMEDFVCSKVVNEQWTHLQLSCHRQSLYPDVRGFSIRTIPRFCADRKIHRTSRQDTEEVEQAVAEAVQKVHIKCL